MTAINVLCLPDKVTVYSDGVASTENGVPSFFVTKVLPIPHMRLALAARGRVDLLSMVGHVAQAAAANFDELFTNLVPALQAEMNSPNSPDWVRSHLQSEFDIVCAGYSETRGFTCFVVVNHPHHGLPPWMAIECPGGFAVPKFDTAFLSPLQAAADKASVMLPIFESQRSTTGANKMGAIGGFVQATTISKDEISTRIIGRWPDLAGERINVPARLVSEPVGSL